MTTHIAKTIDDIRGQAKKKKGPWIKVGLSTCGIAAGAQDVFQKFKEEAERRGLDLRVERCGCAGKCYAEPLVEVSVDGVPRVVYGRVDPAVAVDIIEKHVIGKELINDHIYIIKAD